MKRIFLLLTNGTCICTAFPRGLGSKTPYYSQEIEQEVGVPSNCKPVQINMLVRHGTRYPTTKVIHSINQLVRKLNAVGQQKHPTWLRSWDIDQYYPVEENGMLAKAGVVELVALGNRIREKYGSDFHSSYSKSYYTFEHTWKDRTRESASAFAYGYFDGHHPVHYEAAPQGNDEELRFFDNCNKYDQEVDKNKTVLAEYELFASGNNILKHLEDFRVRLQAPWLSSKEMLAAYEGCAFDIAVHGIYHHWCSLFSQESLLAFEYLKELKQYYRKGYGSPLSVAIASPLLQDIVQAMQNRTVHSSIQGHFRFGHAETLLPFLSLLGYKSEDESPLKASTLKFTERHFQSAVLAPFSGNVAIVLYECLEQSQKELRVQIVVNERQIETPGLGSSSERNDKTMTKDLFRYMDEQDKCLLLTDGFARFIQLILGFCAIGVLFIKRELETPKRNLNVWMFDVSKQGLGALFVHIINIILSIILTRRSKAEDDECAIYFVTFLVDVTFGTFLVLLFLGKVKIFAERMQWTSIARSGEYGDPLQYIIWLKQLISYLIILIAMKIVVTIVIYLLYVPLAKGSTYIFSIFHHHRHAELVVVMILGPCIVNVIQFWILDNYLKHVIISSKKIYTDDDIDKETLAIDDPESLPQTPLLS